MRPFRSAALLLSSLFATPALAAPDLAVIEVDPIAEIRADASGARFSLPHSYWPTAATVTGPDLPLSEISSLDTHRLFRALMLGRDVRSERAGQGDLVGLLPLLREEQRAAIFELRGDQHDAREVIDLRPGQQIGMR